MQKIGQKFDQGGTISPIAEQHELIKDKTLPKQKTIIYVIYQIQVRIMRD